MGAAIDLALPSSRSSSLDQRRLLLWLLFFGQIIAAVYTLGQFPQWSAAAWDGLIVNSLYTYCVIIAVWLASRPLTWFRTAPARIWKLLIYWLLLNLGSWILLILLAWAIQQLHWLSAHSLINGPFFIGTAMLVGLLCVVATNQLSTNYTLYKQTTQLRRDHLQALHARIRPHFLFNGMNSVSSLIPVDPERAETVLQNLADVFRIVLADARKLVPLSVEVELSRQYLEIEQLRMGDRLKIEWNTDHLPVSARVPSLILQPLIENSVYHGIEPRFAGGTIAIEIWPENERLHFMISNPLPEVPKPKQYRKGNKIALDNVRKRLAYHYGPEAYMNNFVNDKKYFVKMALPIQY